MDLVLVPREPVLAAALPTVADAAIGGSSEAGADVAAAAADVDGSVGPAGEGRLPPWLQACKARLRITCERHNIRRFD
jgi:hypothetical protein